MNTLLSIIVTHYNYHEHIPQLLTSILEQGLSGYEVVFVDDGSSIPPEDALQPFIEKGMPIHLVKHASQQYTVKARITGVENAKGKYITFIDADDVFQGKTLLKTLLTMIEAEQADMLQFAVDFHINGVQNPWLCNWASPLAHRLHDKAIFSTYLEQGYRSHLVYGRIVTRALWQKCLPHAKASSVRRYQEDFFFVSLLLFHAKSYIGVNRMGISSGWVNKDAIKAAGRAATNYALLNEFIPYISQCGANAQIVEDFANYCQDNMKRNFGIYLDYLKEQGRPITLETILHDMSPHADRENSMKMLSLIFNKQ